MANNTCIMCSGLGALAATWRVEFLLRFTNWCRLFAVLAVTAFAVAFTVFRVVPNARQNLVRTGEDMRRRDIILDPMFRRYTPLSASCLGTVLAVQSL